MEMHERAIVRIIAPIEVLAGVLLIASVATFAAVTANPAMDVPGAMARLGSMPVVLALFALVTATTLLDEQLSIIQKTTAFVRRAPANRSTAPAVIVLPDTTVVAMNRDEPDLPALRDAAAESEPWWAEWMTPSDQNPGGRRDGSLEPVTDAAETPDFVDLIEERASRPLVDLIA